MTRASAHTSTRTRNRMVKAVGNLKPRLGLSGAWVAAGAGVLVATSVPARGRLAAEGTSCSGHRRGPCQARSLESRYHRFLTRSYLRLLMYTGCVLIRHCV